jgi:hypothetical protein
VPIIIFQITNCKDCPLCEYNEWWHGYECKRGNLSKLLGKDYNDEVEREMIEVMEWANGKPEGCLAL